MIRSFELGVLQYNNKVCWLGIYLIPVFMYDDQVDKPFVWFFTTLTKGANFELGLTLFLLILERTNE